MKCPKCQTENPDNKKFCHECGAKLILICPRCGGEILPSDKFCGECGQDLSAAEETRKVVPEAEGERKYVTVLFSDLSGYTTMTEKLDPEEVKEIMSRIFGEIAQVVTKYEGFIEKFIGDAVMALFGVPKVHEDDPVRAILAAREIHDLVEALSPGLPKKIGRSISMHTGINTGLVVTGEVDMEKGTHGVAGDTINLASRLQGLAQKGEILVGHDTYRRAERHFLFEPMEPTTVKGKADSVQVYRVLSQKEGPVTTHRLSGLRANLVGRKGEMAELADAVKGLSGGKGRIFSICGDAGAGKSRLVEDFKATLDLKEIQWLEGHAYAYSQNIPYFPLINFLNGVFHIEEKDSSEKIRDKIESGIKDLIGKSTEIVPYVGNLYALTYPELEDVSAELWKNRLEEAMKEILTALAKRAPTVFFLEDLHWADRSFMGLLRRALLEIRQPAIVLCVYRPTFSLFTSHQLGSVRKLYHEISLQDLSLSDAQAMLASLLKTEDIPPELKRWVQDKTEGNPFYLEELVNTLIESEVLIRQNRDWKITRPIKETDISSSIHGLISSRVDRLEKETKRILQEASVIGRAFLWEILKRITHIKENIDRSLNGLEQLDLIRTRSFEPELEYIFKHALTQEVVYNGLLKKERRAIHERIGLVMEQLFQGRLSEFYETLAFHFKQGLSILKAVHYLMKSGEKSLKRYAVEESHQYYKEAFDLLAKKPVKTKEEQEILIDLIIEWAYVFNFRGAFKRLHDLVRAHEGLAESLDDKARLGMLYVWLGMSAYLGRGRHRNAYQYLRSALKLGEETENLQVIGYATGYLTWVCAELGLLEEGISFGEKAQEIARLLPHDSFLQDLPRNALAYLYWNKGETKKVFKYGKDLLDHGERNSDIRSLVWGWWITGLAFFGEGNLQSAIQCMRKGLQIYQEPYYSQIVRFSLGAMYASGGQFQEAEEILQQVVAYSREYGVERLGIPASMYLGAALIGKGQMGRGLELIEQAQGLLLENDNKGLYAVSEHILGKVYLQIVERAAPMTLSTIAKNIGFLIRNVPFASKKAEYHFKKAIEVTEEHGFKGFQGQAYLDLGLLHKVKGRRDQARECISASIELFEQCEAEGFLKQAKEALASLR